MSKNAYQLKAEMLTRKFAPYLEEYAPCLDDRMLVVNLHKQLVEACKAMENMDNAFICVAVNNHFAEQEAWMERIVTRFSGKVYKAHRWVDPDTSVYKVKEYTVEDGEGMELNLMDTVEIEFAIRYAKDLIDEGRFAYVMEELPDGTSRRVFN